MFSFEKVYEVINGYQEVKDKTRQDHMAVQSIETQIRDKDVQIQTLNDQILAQDTKIKRLEQSLTDQGKKQENQDYMIVLLQKQMKRID